jgi:hypothetical protein
MASFYLELMVDGPLPIELCEYILEFADEQVPVVCNKASTPTGWFCYSIRSKLISEVLHESELDICRKCNCWRSKCRCSSDEETSSED